MYDHMFDVCFSVESDIEDPDEITAEELIKGMEERLEYLKKNPELEAFGHCDSYNMEELCKKKSKSQKDTTSP